MQATENDLRSKRPEEASEFEGAFGESEVNGDTDDVGDWVRGRGALEQVFIPVANGPFARGGGRDAGEGE